MVLTNYLHQHYSDIFHGTVRLINFTNLPLVDCMKMVKVQEEIFRRIFHEVPDIFEVIQMNVRDVRVENIIKSFKGVYNIPIEMMEQQATPVARKLDPSNMVYANCMPSYTQNQNL